MPIATSRSLSFSPNSPMPIPAISVKPMSPASGETPNSAAPVAPVKPTWLSAWPAKVWPRSTRKKPTKPASTAATPEAAKAVRIKSYSNMLAVVVVMVMGRAARGAPVLVAMRVRLDLDAAGQHEHPLLDAHNLDIGLIEPREHGRRHHLVDRAQHRRAGAE